MHIDEDDEDDGEDEDGDDDDDEDDDEEEEEEDEDEDDDDDDDEEADDDDEDEEEAEDDKWTPVSNDRGGTCSVVRGVFFTVVRWWLWCVLVVFNGLMWFGYGLVMAVGIFVVGGFVPLPLQKKCAACHPYLHLAFSFWPALGQITATFRQRTLQRHAWISQFHLHMYIYIYIFERKNTCHDFASVECF